MLVCKIDVIDKSGNVTGTFYAVNEDEIKHILKTHRTRVSWVKV